MRIWHAIKYIALTLLLMMIGVCYILAYGKEEFDLINEDDIT